MTQNTNLIITNMDIDAVAPPTTTTPSIEPVNDSSSSDSDSESESNNKSSTVSKKRKNTNNQNIQPKKKRKLNNKKDKSDSDSDESDESVESGESAESTESTESDKPLKITITKKPPPKTSAIGVLAKLLKSSSYKLSEQEELNKIYSELNEEAWFQKLPSKRKQYYIKKMKDLRTYGDPIPTIKDILDLNLEPDQAKKLINDRYDLDMYNKMSNTYNQACDRFVRAVNDMKKEKEKNKGKPTNINFESILLNQPKFFKSMKERIFNSGFSNDIKAVIYDKYVTMSRMDKHDSTKYNTWLDIVLSIPHQPKKILLDQLLPQNEAISKLIVNLISEMNKKIYGLEEAKEELICMIVNMIINPVSKHKAIGFCGPPGVGKTMIAKVISDVLQLPMEQISLGGITDSSFFEGHDFTYSGSEPGCIAKSIIKLGCTNGILFFDELDKISKTDKGKEIEHSLLHISDFTYNYNYRDKYMSEIPINLSDYIFIYSMNSNKELDAALASRIPIINFNGYTLTQKIDITKNHIIPELLINYGMKEGIDIIINKREIEYLISHVQEKDEINGRSGVRSLKKIFNRILNRINLYKLAAINGKINAQLSFNIPNFKIPYTLTIDLINQILKNSEDIIDNKHLSYYL